MKFLAPVTKLAAGFRKFVAPRYRPELYYMRGPGPATARRMGTPRQNRSIDHYASRTADALGRSAVRAVPYRSIQINEGTM